MKIAHSLNLSADSSTRRKAPLFCFALLILVYYINRAGKNPDGNLIVRFGTGKGRIVHNMGGIGMGNRTKLLKED